MNTLGTIWLLVVMGTTGDLKVVDILPTQAACATRIAKAASTDGMCVQALAAAAPGKR